MRSLSVPRCVSAGGRRPPRLPLLALALSMACGPAPERGTLFTPAAGSERTTLEVDNQNWAEMRVHVCCGSARHRLGTVSTNHRSVFAVPEMLIAASGPITFLAEGIGPGNTYRSDPIVLNTGSRYVLTISNRIAQSRVTMDSP